jgi:hypothetical protein
MSDSVKKWHEMQEEKEFTKRVQALEKGKTFIFESPDGGKTVTRRPFMGDISEREVILHPTSELKIKAYRLLTEYDEQVIRLAAKILDIGE